MTLTVDYLARVRGVRHAGHVDISGPSLPDRSTLAFLVDEREPDADEIVVLHVREND